MTDAQRVAGLLKKLVEGVKGQSELAMACTDAVLALGDSICGLQEVEVRRWKKHVAQMRYDPSSGCCHGRKR